VLLEYVTILQASIDACLAAFKTIGEKYVAGQLSLDELYPARDQLLRGVKEPTEMYVSRSMCV